MSTTRSPIVHIVCFQLKSAADGPEVQSRFEQLRQSSLLPSGQGQPAIQSLKGGSNTSQEGAHKEMTVGYVLEFATQEHLEFYLNECPAHQEFKRFVKPLIQDAFVFDFEDGKVTEASMAQRGPNLIRERN